MTIIFSDDDLKYLNRREYDTLIKFQEFIKNLKSYDDNRFCKKCGHVMYHSRIYGIGIWECGFCGEEEK